jgi:rhamnogalacturonan endolyase
MEFLGRGVVAVRQPDGSAFVSWRLLGTEAEGTAFNVYRSTERGQFTKLNAAPIAGPTHFVDANADAARSHAYSVRPLVNVYEVVSGASPVTSASTLAAGAPAKAYLSIKLQTPAGYTPNDIAPADLDGDGEYELVLHQAGRGKDNSQNGETDPPILQAYKLDGTLLWSINLGRNIREGAHYTQFMAYDLDGDGRAEIACKTADGTVDGTGKVIGDAKANYVDGGGRILAGPEYLTVFDGLTGGARDTVPYIPSRIPEEPGNLQPSGDAMKKVWGDGYGNRGDRFLACVAYLDGVLPSLVMCRGYYTRSFLVAFDFRGGKIQHRWTFDSEKWDGYSGQGNHSLAVADVDADGRDEIIYGKMAVDDDGRGLYTTKIGHGDAQHLSDLDPARPGLEVFSIQEPFADAGAHIFDARTGEILWKKPSTVKKPGGDGEGPGRGLALDVDPRHAGFEAWAAGAGLSGQMWNVRGEKIADKTPSVNFGVFWDGDPLSELLDGTTISKWDWQNSTAVPLLEAGALGVASNNGSKATPALSADILGDWREEVIWRAADNSELHVFTTTIPTTLRLPTLMHDPVYRLSVAWQNVAYNQPPHPSFFLGDGMAKPPRPHIQTTRATPANAAAPANAATTNVATPTVNIASPAPNAAKPTIFVVGDSTARNNANGARGWGDPFADFFDASKATVSNRARAGRSSRTFVSEGLWDVVAADLKPGDFVLIQMGHNDGGPVDTGRGRASLPGLGEETREITRADGTRETVRTYGWYLRKMIADAKAKGAQPVLMSLTIRNIWKDGKVERGSGAYGNWARETAAAQGIPFIDVASIISDRYQAMGQEPVKAMFGPDYVHTSPAGAEVNAASVVLGLKQTGHPLAALLSEKGRAVAAGAANPVQTTIPAANTSALRPLPVPGDPALPSLVLIGDSTVRNGSGDGGGGQWGWGEPLAAYFDAAKVNVVNRAVGGLSSRTYRTMGYWEQALALLKPGDVLMMQFGHNDAGTINDPTRARATLRGAGDETQEIDNMLTKQREVVGTYGSYLRRYVREAKAKGALPIVLSPVPRKNWQDGKITSSAYAGWAEIVAQTEGVPFIDLNALVVRRYNEMGLEKVEPLFADANTHTSLAGAEVNAAAVVEGLKALNANPVASYFSAKAAAVAVQK